VRIDSAHDQDNNERGSDRRTRNGSFYYPERRHGFERRHPPEGTWRARYHSWLEQYRHDNDTIAVALLVFVLLNLADLLLTVRALSMGAVEGNPIMAFLFAVDPTLAAMFKVVVGAGIALAVWSARRYRRILETSLVMVAVMTAVLLYHGYSALI
jgi:hypothetical protein